MGSKFSVSIHHSIGRNEDGSYYVNRYDTREGQTTYRDTLYDGLTEKKATQIAKFLDSIIKYEFGSGWHP